MDSTQSTAHRGCLFFDQKYAQIQQFENFQKFESDQFIICFNVTGHQAFSLPKSPFGGFFTDNANKTDLLRFYENVENSLINLGVNEIYITQPQSVYRSIPKGWMKDIGFNVEQTEIGHYLPLKGDLINRIHQMERRKLKTSKTYYVSQEGHENLAEIHQFLSVCRKHQDLNINVSLESLQSQVESFPNQYRIFSARKDAELMSAVIMNAATENIAYYFLPGTLPKFKKFSPMVGLIGHIYRDYQNEGFEYIDFGISSVDEVPQRSLITFKEHMGGIRNERITYFKQLTE